MPQVEFEPIMPVFKLAKTVHALDRGANVIGVLNTIQRYPVTLTQPMTKGFLILVLENTNLSKQTQSGEQI
jgi:hypothetical protein